MEFKILNSLSQIDPLDWERVFGDIPEGYSFYKSLEESCLQEFSFYYAVLYRSKQAVLIAPLFIADFNLDIAVDGFLERFIAGLRRVFPRFLIIKTLFCGAPFSECGIIGISPGLQDKDAALAELLQGLDDFSRQKKVGLVIFKDFQDDYSELLSPLLKGGFFKLHSFPAAINELKFNSLQDYIQSLGSATRKNLRRKIKSAYSQAKISVQIVERADDIIEEVLRLYSSTLAQGGTKFEKLTKEFFLSVARNMQPNARFFLYYVNDKLAAFNLCFIYKDLCIDKFIGFDYDISRCFHLYFVSWCYNIEWCLKNSIRFYKTGQTDYDAKLRLGGRLIPLYAYIRHRNRGVNLFLRLLSLVLKPDNFDSATKGDQHE